MEEKNKTYVSDIERGIYDVKDEMHINLQQVKD